MTVKTRPLELKKNSDKSTDLRTCKHKLMPC